MKSTKHPTPIPTLNQVLEKLVEAIKSQLADNFVGAYLQGSFAIGDFTQSSDADVLVVIKEDIKNQEIDAFQKLHKQLFKDLPKPWGQRIELSYAPVDIIKTYSKTPRDPSDYPRSADWRDPSTGVPPTVYPFWYLDNGTDTLVRSEHDNTNVVRWTTREKGVVLAGPDPKTLIDEVTPTDLAIGNRDLFRFLNREWAAVEKLSTVMLQTFFVTLCVRALHTLETGTVTSKKEATEWALANLDPQWKSLIEKAWDEWSGSRENLSNKADEKDAEMTVRLIQNTLKKAEELSR
jgi:predicted nucleotidyltransferase